MDLFDAFNAPAVVAVQERPQYRSNASLEQMRLHRVEDALITRTPRGPALKLILHSPTDEYLFTCPDVMLQEEQCKAIKELVASDTAPFYFTAIGKKGTRINGLVPFSAEAAAIYKANSLVVGNILPPTLRNALVVAELINA